MMSQLFYTGPSLDDLHEQFAKRARLDSAAPIRATQETHIEATPARVWTLLSDPAGWSAIDPAIHDVRLATRVEVDARFTWANGKAKIASRFAVVDHERELTWTGSSMGARAVHRHILKPLSGGGTLLRSEESMAGPLLTLFYGSEQLNKGLALWLKAIKTSAERS